MSSLIKSDFSMNLNSSVYPLQLLAAIQGHANEDKMALRSAFCPENGVTFAQLHQYSLAIAAFLKNRDISKGDVVCLALPNCWEYAAIFLELDSEAEFLPGRIRATKKVGIVEMEHHFLDSGCKIVFCTEWNMDVVIKAVPNCPLVQSIVLVNTEKSKENEEIRAPSGIIPLDHIFTQYSNANLLTDNLANITDIQPKTETLLIPYSSGTSGKPKGVLISHQSFGTMMDIFSNHFQKCIYPYLDPPYVVQNENELLLLPFFHCYGFGMLIQSLMAGSMAIVMDASKGFKLNLFCASVATYKIRLLKLVPPILVALAKNALVENYDLSHLSAIISGAAPIGKEILQKVQNRFPNLQLVAQGFGMTEMTFATHLPIMDNPIGTVGKLVANHEMKIVNRESGTEITNLGMPGEMFLRGPTMMSGYLNRPDETAATIDSNGWLRTGDIVELCEGGFIKVVDRAKELIKVNGFQVAPAELEAIVQSHPDVEDCAVIGVESENAGQLPRAFVVLKKGAAIAHQEIQQFVEEKVVHYKQLKGGVRFVEEIPKNPSGKILRRKLQEMK